MNVAVLAVPQCLRPVSFMDLGCMGVGKRGLSWGWGGTVINMKEDQGRESEGGDNFVQEWGSWELIWWIAEQMIGWAPENLSNGYVQMIGKPKGNVWEMPAEVTVEIELRNDSKGLKILVVRW